MVSRNSVTRRNVLAVSLAFAVSLTAVPAFAEGQATDLDGVIVTATRTARTQDATLAAVTVIDREEIQRLQPASLQELLRKVPGASIANNGGAGKESSIFLRGTESDHVLVLIDGLKVGSATSGKAALQDIPVEQIERIEVVRGPFSSLYGSEAIGGVIQIFTRRPQVSFSPSFSAGAGSESTYKATAGVEGRGDKGWYALNLAHDTTDGFNACYSPAGCFGYDPDIDGYTNNSVSAQGGYTFGDALNVDLRALRAEGENEYDGSISAGNEAKTVQQTGGARVRYRAGDIATLTLNMGQSQDKSRQFYNGDYHSLFRTDRDQGALQADFSLAGGTLTTGLDWVRDAVESDTAYAVTERITRAAFAQWQQGFGAHSLQASVRRDDNSQFGGKTTGSALWGWDFTEALRLTASYGTAFKAPTFNELYFPFYGNPTLTPETSRSVELGLRGEHGWGEWSVNAFETNIDDLIGTYCTPTWECYAINVDEARIQGVELTAGTELAGWDLQGSASWIDPRNESTGLDHGNILPRRARETARLDADRRFGDFNVGASVTAAGERYENLANSHRLGGYATTDLRAGYAFNPSWRVNLSLNNVFDKQYETAAYYNQPGRTWMLTLRYAAQ